MSFCLILVFPMLYLSSSLLIVSLRVRVLCCCYFDPRDGCMFGSLVISFGRMVFLPLFLVILIPYRKSQFSDILTMLVVCHFFLKLLALSLQHSFIRKFYTNGLINGRSKLNLDFLMLLGIFKYFNLF